MIQREKLGVGCVEISPTAVKYLNQALKNKRLSYGPFVKKFERGFARMHQAKFAVMVNSGTSALRIAVAALKELERWKEGDEVIVPAVTFVATANVVLQQGLKPVFVDVDSRTYNIDPEKIAAKITKRTRAIIPVHLFGQSADIVPIVKIARKHGLKIIEDSCETMGVNYRGKRVGSFGDISCFSTYAAHLIVTGVGGLAVTSSRKYAEVLRSLANHGRDGIYFTDKKGSRELIARRFRFIRPGFSFRVTEMEGALGLAQLSRLPIILRKRRRNARYLISKLKPFEKFLQLPSHPAYIEHAFMMFPIVIRKNARIKKEILVNYLEKQGIETRDMLPLINQPYLLKSYKLQANSYPVADWINNYGFYIGCHQLMGRPELDYIIKMFKKFFKI
ncbi:MAG: DegT/DnrJ/EryC1/StrS family aminotransferase [Candidatus Doudnabacteria bacterium]|nr:DegT/DnrJ/EryC1/StrS family aminotransferase [Candidatus Doudnabacteria bacterium]